MVSNSRKETEFKLALLHLKIDLVSLAVFGQGIG